MKASLLSPRERVVITGLGVVTPVGVGLEAFWEALTEGRSGIDWIQGFDTSKLYCKIGGEVRNFNAADFRPAKKAARSGRFSNMAVAAAQLAVRDAALDTGRMDPYDMGAIFGTTMAGLGNIGDDVYALLHRQDMDYEGLDMLAPSEVAAHSATANVFIDLGMKGPNSTSGVGCVSTLDAMNSAAYLLRSGRAKMMIAGAAEACVSEVGFSVLARQGVLTHHNDPPAAACRPYDRNRDGLVLSEGSAAVVLETAEHAMDRGARIHAEFLGYSATTEAYHLLLAKPDGEELARAFRQALLQAKIAPGEIDYVCAHGISNKQYDVAETNAVKMVMGERAYHVPMSSIKSMTGQPFAAGGGWQVAAACMAMDTGVVPPTINYVTPDPECDLDYVPNVARRARVETVMINSHSVGGTHACLLLRRFA
jgi:3-oxoacyl-[acyl-carrier-protein] synthase II